MGSKSLMAAPLQAKRCQIEPVCFHVTHHIIEKTQILHHKGFDVHISESSHCKVNVLLFLNLS